MKPKLLLNLLTAAVSVAAIAISINTCRQAAANRARAQELLDANKAAAHELRERARQIGEVRP
jgi:hypothetical protein